MAFHPDVQEAAARSGPERHLEPVFLQPAERRAVRAAVRQAPALRSARVWLLEPEASPDELPALRATVWALRSERASPPGQAGPQGPLQAARLQQADVSAGSLDAPVLPGAAAEPVHAAAGLLPEEAAESVHAAAEPLPEAASAAWAQQASAGAPDGSRAAEPAASDVPARQPAGVQRADAAGQPQAAVRPDAWERRAAVQPVVPDALRAAVPSALPWEAASVFRQGPALAGPARPRAAARFAHAMRSLRFASRSERSWQAARSEDWSCREIPRKVL
ncbi:hypothetical protein ABIA96_004388 [Bradyrhizobium sp. LB11.1]